MRGDRKGEGRRKKEEGRRKKEEGRRKTGIISFNWQIQWEIRQTGRCWS
ncbi:hypothetical protein QUA56_19375 [Microcoleus sp. N3A4]